MKNAKCTFDRLWLFEWVYRILCKNALIFTGRDEKWYSPHKNNNNNWNKNQIYVVYTLDLEPMPVACHHSVYIHYTLATHLWPFSQHHIYSGILVMFQLVNVNAYEMLAHFVDSWLCYRQLVGNLWDPIKIEKKNSKRFHKCRRMVIINLVGFKTYLKDFRISTEADEKDDFTTTG